MKDKLQVKIHIWSDHIAKHELYNPVLSQLIGGNIGHASAELQLPIDQESKKLITKCEKLGIPFTVKQDKDGNEIYYSVYLSVWADQDNKISFKDSLIKDRLEERIGREVKYSELGKKIIPNPEQRKVKGALNKKGRLIKQAPLTVIHHRNLNKEQSSIIEEKAKYLKLSQDLYSIDFLYNRIKDSKGNKNLKNIKIDYNTKQLIQKFLPKWNKFENLTNIELESLEKEIKTTHENMGKIINIGLFYKFEKIIDLLQQSEDKGNFVLNEHTCRLLSNEVEILSLFQENGYLNVYPGLIINNDMLQELMDFYDDFRFNADDFDYVNQYMTYKLIKNKLPVLEEIYNSDKNDLIQNEELISLFNEFDYKIPIKHKYCSDIIDLINLTSSIEVIIEDLEEQLNSADLEKIVLESDDLKDLYDNGILQDLKIKSDEILDDEGNFIGDSEITITKDQATILLKELEEIYKDAEELRIKNNWRIIEDPVPRKNLEDLIGMCREMYKSILDNNERFIKEADKLNYENLTDFIPDEEQYLTIGMNPDAEFSFNVGNGKQEINSKLCLEKFIEIAEKKPDFNLYTAKENDYNCSKFITEGFIAGINDDNIKNKMFGISNIYYCPGQVKRYMETFNKAITGEKISSLYLSERLAVNLKLHNLIDPGASKAKKALIAIKTTAILGLYAMEKVLHDFCSNFKNLTMKWNKVFKPHNPPKINKFVLDKTIVIQEKKPKKAIGKFYKEYNKHEDKIIAFSSSALRNFNREINKNPDGEIAKEYSKLSDFAINRAEKIFKIEKLKEDTKTKKKLVSSYKASSLNKK